MWVGFLYTVVSMDQSGLREITTSRKASCPSDSVSRYAFLPKMAWLGTQIWLLRRISWNVGDTPVPPSLPMQSVLTLLPLGPSAGLWGIHVSYRLQFTAMSVMHFMLRCYFYFVA